MSCTNQSSKSQRAGGEGRLPDEVAAVERVDRIGRGGSVVHGWLFCG